MKTLKLPTKPIFIKNENFQTILINIIFPYQEKEEELEKIKQQQENLLEKNNQKVKTLERVEEV